MWHLYAMFEHLLNRQATVMLTEEPLEEEEEETSNMTSIIPGQHGESAKLLRFKGYGRRVNQHNRTRINIPPDSQIPRPSATYRFPSQTPLQPAETTVSNHPSPRSRVVNPTPAMTSSPVSPEQPNLVSPVQFTEPSLSLVVCVWIKVGWVALTIQACKLSRPG